MSSIILLLEPWLTSILDLYGTRVQVYWLMEMQSLVIGIAYSVRVQWEKSTKEESHEKLLCTVRI